MFTNVLNFHGNKIVEYWRYRTARVYGVTINFMALQDEKADSCHEELRKWLERNGYSLDNHICWKDSNGLFYMYSDWNLIIGNDIRIQNW